MDSNRENDVSRNADFLLGRPLMRGSKEIVRWGTAFVLVLALHIGTVAYIVAQRHEPAESETDIAIAVDLLRDPSEVAEKPDAVAGPNIAELTLPTSPRPDADDAEPPAPDAPPPTKLDHRSDASNPQMNSELPTDPEAVLPPKTEAEPERKLEELPPDPILPVERDAQKDVADRRTAPSRASTGSADLLSGGRRPAAATQATWRGAISNHLTRHRRFPASALARGVQGTARMRVTIDGNGHVLKRELAQSSGSQILDDEAFALMERCDPFPEPPMAIGVPVVLSIPVKFAIR